MRIHAPIIRAITSFKQRAARFARDGRGVAAVEFAFIAPVLLCLYFVTMEVAQAIEANKKVGRAASMIADLVTQQQSEITPGAVLEPIMAIGEATLQPYNRTTLNAVVTGIKIDDTGKVIAKWSWKMVNGVFSRAAAPDSTTTVPAKLKINDTFLVRVEASLAYQPVITWTAGQKQTLGLMSAFDQINMKEIFYLRPRMTQEIACVGC